jgi:hypothetical protein
MSQSIIDVFPNPEFNVRVSSRTIRIEQGDSDPAIRPGLLGILNRLSGGEIGWGSNGTNFNPLLPSEEGP